MEGIDGGVLIEQRPGSDPRALFVIVPTVPTVLVKDNRRQTGVSSALNHRSSHASGDPISFGGDALFQVGRLSHRVLPEIVLRES